QSVATLQERHLDVEWRLRGVRVKGGQTRDIPLPSAVTRFLQTYLEQTLTKEMVMIPPDTPLFWSTWGRRSGGKSRARAKTSGGPAGSGGGSPATGCSSHMICAMVWLLGSLSNTSIPKRGRPSLG